MSNWLGVVSKDHVMRAVSLRIGQVGHGKRPPLTRMRAGDWFVYYSPRQQIDAGAALQAFTAVGEIADDEIWQADEGSFTPWRRRVTYLDGVHDVPVKDLALDLTAGPNWGYQLRKGLIELSDHDLQLIKKAMTQR